MGNQQDGELIARDAVDGQRRAVQADRAFLRNEMRQRKRRAQIEMRHAVEIATRDNFRKAIDMAGDDMPAELVTHFQGTFEIDSGAGAPGSHIGQCQRFSSGIDLEPGAVAQPPHCHRRQAGARTGNGSANGNAFRRIGAGNADTAQLAPRFDAQDFTDIGNKAGEHQRKTLS